DALFATAHRAECANTVRIAVEADRSKGIRLRHTGSIAGKIDDARRALGIAVKGVEAFKDQAEALSKTPLPAGGVKFVANDILDAALEITAADMAKGADVLAKAVAKTAAQQALAEKAIERQIQERRDILEDILRRYESDTV